MNTRIKYILTPAQKCNTRISLFTQEILHFNFKCYNLLALCFNMSCVILFRVRPNRSCYIDSLFYYYLNVGNQKVVMGSLSHENVVHDSGKGELKMHCDKFMKQFHIFFYLVSIVPPAIVFK